jgi:hypothetical protein
LQAHVREVPEITKTASGKVAYETIFGAKE